MKPIKITEANSVAIVMALDAVNGKAWNHTFSTYKEIANIAAEAETRVVEIVGSQRAAVGAVMQAVSGQKVANSYKYARIGTRVVIERRSTGWFLIKISAETLYSNQGGARILSLTPAQDTKAIEVLRASYIIETAFDAVLAETTLKNQTPSGRKNRFGVITNERNLFRNLCEMS